MRQMFVSEVLLRVVSLSRYRCRRFKVRSRSPEARVREATRVPLHKTQSARQVRGINVVGDNATIARQEVQSRHNRATDTIKVVGLVHRHFRRRI